ncbi:MAG TPA: glycosyltransferase family 2 protein [Pirellulales bacterium]|nr:glycosyltransferase family 2 protein [Pirellulales bacterium]
MKKLSIIVPVYYNEQSLPPLFDELERVEAGLRDRGMAMELIFVDDGSRDGSFVELLNIRRRRPATKLIRLTRNFGAVLASGTGMRYVSGDCFVVIAADLQDPPTLVLEMVDHWLRGTRFVICVRRSRQDPPLTKTLAWLYYQLLRKLVVADYPSTGFDMALMDRSMLPHMLASGKNVHPTIYAYSLGFECQTILYDRRQRKHGRSRWTLLKKLKLFSDSFLGFSPFPLRLVAMIGLGMATLSGCYGLSVGVNALAGNRPVPGFATLIVLLSCLLSVMIAMLAIIGEYLWRVFEQVSPRPQVVIDTELLNAAEEEPSCQLALRKSA